MFDPAQQSYREIFEQRGRAYHQAMLSYPEARAEEFLQLLSRADLQSGEWVADVPSGGGYLANYIPDNIRLLSVDSCREFIANTRRARATLSLMSEPNALALGNNQLDCLLSLAGLHHMADKRPMFQEVTRVLKPGGRFVIADVHEASPVARFLDQTVDRYNRMGHRGAYLCDSTLKQLRDSGLAIDSHHRCRFYWWFASEADLLEFCALMFGLDQLVPSAFIKEVREVLGLTAARGRVGMPWELYFICGRNPK